MRSKTIALLVAAVSAAAILVPAASAAGPPAGCIQWNKITKVCKRFVESPPVSPVAHPSTPPNTAPCPPSCGPVPVVPVVTPPSPIMPTPVIDSGRPVKAFCVATVERGWTFVQANDTSFDVGGDWYALWKSGARVVLDGHAVTLQYLDGTGVRDATLDPVVGLTC